MEYMMIKKLLYIMAVLFNIVQVEAMQIEEEIENQNDNDISTLRATASLFRDMTENGEQGDDLFFNICKNIREINKDTLHFLSMVERKTKEGLRKYDEQTLYKILNILDNFQSDETKLKEISSNISKMDQYTLFDLFNVFDVSYKVTQNILFNITKINDENKLYYLSNVISKLGYEITPEILTSTTNMNANALRWMDYILSKLRLNKNKISQETLLNIIKMSNIRTLKDLDSILSNLQKEGIKNDSFINIRENIKKINKNASSNTNEMSVDKLYVLCDILDKLPPNNIKKDILNNIISMDEYRLNSLSSILYTLPKEGKVLNNIIMMDEDTLTSLQNLYLLDYQKQE